MKHLLLVLFAGLLLNMHVFAQWDYDPDYDSDYDSDYDEQPETGATNITVNNSGTEDQSVQKLTLPNSQPIYLYFYNNVQNPTSPEPVVQPQPAVTKVEPTPREPEPVIEYRYIPLPAPEPPPPPPPPQVEYRYIPVPVPEPVYIPPPPPQIEYRYIPPPPVEYIYIPPPPVEPVYVQPPAPMQIRVIPGLPDPKSPRIYRIQVGSYAKHNTADLMAQRIRAAGLHAGIENYNSLKRVFVPGVRAADAGSIVQMLELLGFQEVWIRE